MTKPIFSRMWNKVDISEWEADPNSHWWWTASTAGKRPSASNGYGRLNVTRNGTQRTVYAHRYFYELLVGPIPSGFTIDHLCRVTTCVNPDHLEAVSMQENLLRSKTALAAINSRKSHCPQGHAYDGANLIGTLRKRTCRECNRKNSRQQRLKRR